MFNTDENRLHYDLSFLNIGEPWKPKGDTRRLESYRFSQEQFELTPEDMVKKLLPDGMLSLNDYSDFTNATKLMAYPRLLTLKTVDMVMGQPPNITAQNDDKMSEMIRDIRNSSKLNEAFKQALIDYSRFGVLLLRVFKREDGRAGITAWDPSEWIPVFYPDGTNRIHYNVIGWVIDSKLTVQIHDTEDGSYTEKVFQLNTSNLISKLLSTKKYNKGTKHRLLYAVTNTPTTTNPLGTNDYEIINGLLQKAIARLCAILRVLDEHADPSMTGPHTLLSRSESGETVFRTSKYYAVGNEEQKPEYLVWEANLESSFRAFEELCKQIYILSEMGEAFLGAPGGTGNVVSGTAMRFKMISPLAKARRITNDLAGPLQEIVSALLSIEGVKIDALNINIAWKDSLPKDPRELAELTRLEAGSVAVKPLKNALIDNYELDKETAESYVETILEFLERQHAEAADPATGEDGRSHGPTAGVDTRKKGSAMDPASSENRGEDTGK